MYIVKTIFREGVYGSFEISRLVDKVFTNGLRNDPKKDPINDDLCNKSDKVLLVKAFRRPP